MRSTRLVPYFVAIPVIVILTLVDIWLVGLAVGADTDTLRVSFLDVGQGDAILIETPTGTQVLVDGGTARKVNQPLSNYLPFYDRSIDMVVASHADGDHVGGLQAVLDEYKVSQVVLPARENNTGAYTSFKEAAQNEKRSGGQLRRLSAGDALALGGGVYLLVLSPDQKHAPADPNDSSLVARLMYGETSLLLTGDISHGIETYLASQYGELLDSEVLKVAHHGSKSSSANTFLSAVSPSRAIISAGEDNQYNHPHPEVLERLDSMEVDSACTCNEGTIMLESDGKEFQQIR